MEQYVQLTGSSSILGRQKICLEINKICDWRSGLGVDREWVGHHALEYEL